MTSTILHITKEDFSTAMQHNNFWYIIHYQLKKNQKKSLKMHNREKKRKKTTYDEAKTKTVSKIEPLNP